ncbi:hypothetical protein CIP106467_1429 [Citrobacter europaeus]|nr:hypothetical protein CIP106467_1429 [Citrobacter europaeus]
MNNFDPINRGGPFPTGVGDADGGGATGIAFHHQLIRNGIVIPQRGVQGKMATIPRIIAIDHQLITGLLTIHTGCEGTAVNQVAPHREQEVVAGPGSHLQHTGVIHMTCNAPRAREHPRSRNVDFATGQRDRRCTVPQYQAALLNLRFARPGGVIADGNGAGSQLGHIAATINIVIKLPVGITVQHQ